MKNILYVIMLYCFLQPLNTYAQVQEQPLRRSLKLMLDVNYGIGANRQTFMSVEPAFGYTFLNRYGNQHEFALERSGLHKGNAYIRTNDSMVAYNGTTFYTGLRYQHNFMFRHDKKLKPYIGLGARANYITQRFNPITEDQARQLNSTLVLGTQLVPGVQFNISRDLYLDFALAINLFQFQTSSHALENKLLPVEPRKITNMDFNVLRNNPLQLRFGIGYRFGR